MSFWIKLLRVYICLSLSSRFLTLVEERVSFINIPPLSLILQRPIVFDPWPFSVVFPWDHRRFYFNFNKWRNSSSNHEGEEVDWEGPPIPGKMVNPCHHQSSPKCLLHYKFDLQLIACPHWNRLSSRPFPVRSVVSGSSVFISVFPLTWRKRSVFHEGHGLPIPCHRFVSLFSPSLHGASGIKGIYEPESSLLGTFHNVTFLYTSKT